MGVGGAGKGGGYGVNPSNNAAQGMQQAFNIAGTGPNFGSSPYGMGFGGPRFTTTGMPATIQEGMSTYQNPFEQDVINSVTNDIERQRQIAQGTNTDAAIAAGAFGGSRHGLVERGTNEDAMRLTGDATSALRRQGFMDAAGLSARDIANRMNAGQFDANAANAASNLGFTTGFNNMQFGANDALARAGLLGNLARQSFDMGRTINADQYGMGTASQGMNQNVLNSIQQLFGGFTGQPSNLLNMLQGAEGNSALNAALTKTQQTNPGAGQIIGNLLGAAGSALTFNPINLSNVFSNMFGSSLAPTSSPFPPPRPVYG